MLQDDDHPPLGVSIDVRDEKGMTPLHSAVIGARCDETELEALIAALLEAGADPNELA